MSLLRQLRHGLRALFTSRADQDIGDEVRAYMDEAAAAHRRGGLSADAARRAAAIDVGNATYASEQVRSYGWENVLESAFGDLRYAARRLRHAPGFTVVACGTLALGVGATTAIFSAVNPILFRALPYPHAGEIVMISDRTNDGRPLPTTFGTYRELRQRSRSFTAMAPLNAWQTTLVSEAEPQRLSGQRVGAEFFRVLGVTPAMGRDFRDDDDVANGPNVVIISDRLWRRQFGADHSIVGQPIKLDDVDYTVIGVLPRQFENVLAVNAELWAPLQYNTVFTPDSREWGHHLQLVARLRSGVPQDAAARELDRIAATPVPQFSRVPWARMDPAPRVSSLQADVTKAIRPTLLAIVGAVLLLLAIACVNVTNLVLARGAQRRGEFAMRAALGANRGRLLRQVLTESLVLAAVGGALGIAGAQAGVHALIALSPPELPRVSAIRLDMPALLFAIAVTTALGVVVGLAPAFGAAGVELQEEMQRGSRRMAGSHRRMRSTLVTSEVALAVVLLVGAGLLLRSVSRVFAVDPGFQTSGLLTAQLPLPTLRYRTDAERRRFYRDVLEAVHRAPGVTGAAMTQLLPLGGDVDVYGVHLERDADATADGAATRYAVTPGYFDTMRIPLRRGRLLDDRDDEASPRAVVINESYAHLAFPRGDALGQRLRFGPAEGDWYTVVGVVGDVRQSSFDTQPPVSIYVPTTQWHWVDNPMTLVIRSAADPATLVAALRNAVWSVDKREPVVRVATMSAVVNTSIADRRFALVLFEAFGIAALLLAAIGVYGVLSGAVTERLREIGVRVALGATPAAVVRGIMKQGLAPVAFGIVIGLTLTAGATRVLVTMLFGVSRLDPVTYAGVVVLLTTVASAACAIPAMRASRVDPALTLRSE